MHDVGIALDHHLLGDLHRAGLRHAPGIVAAQIDQHDMFGALLGIRQQFIGECCVFLRRRAAPARAGDRPHRDHVAFEPAQDLG